jgi:aspartokinase
LPNTVELVRRVVERDGAIRSGLSRDLINVRALARYVQTTEKGAANLTSDALISAIRRYPLERSRESYANIGSLVKKLTMKNRIVDVSIVNDPEIPGALGQFASKVDYSRGETFHVVAGSEVTRVVVDEKNLGKLKSSIPNRKIRKTISGLAEIIISLDDQAEKTPGVVSATTTELAMNGINMMEFMSCVPELIIVVDEKDALKSYESLERLSKPG